MSLNLKRPPTNGEAALAFFVVAVLLFAAAGLVAALINHDWSEALAWFTASYVVPRATTKFANIAHEIVERP